jgi:hypothetical protein
MRSTALSPTTAHPRDRLSSRATLLITDSQDICAEKCVALTDFERRTTDALPEVGSTFAEHPSGLGERTSETPP